MTAPCDIVWRRCAFMASWHGKNTYGDRARVLRDYTRRWIGRYCADWSHSGGEAFNTRHWTLKAAQRACQQAHNRRRAA